MGKYQAYPEYKETEFEWLGKVPLLWKPIKFGITNSSAELGGNYLAGEGEEGIPVIKMGNLGRGIVNLKKIERLPINEVYDGEHLLKKDDFLFNTRNSLDLVGKVSIWREELEYAVYNSNILRIKFDKKFVGSTAFMNYLFNSSLGLSQLRLIAKGTTSVAAIYYKELRSLVFALPTIQEQQKIANFLDHETAKIDTLIEKQQQLIALLKEKRQAVISQAVTKGLNPEAPMRDSGVEWLGEVPEHWERKSLNYLIAHTVDNRGRTPPVIDSGIPMAEVSQVAGNGFYTSDNYSKFITQESYDQFVRSDVKENDILFVTVGATFGKTCLVPPSPDFFIAQNVVGFRCVDSVDSKFFMFLLSSSIFKEAISATNKSSTIDNVKVSDLVKTKLVIPSYEEQVDIANHIFTIVDQYEKLVIKAESVIGLMQERRTALISAAVTGKIDVRDFTPKAAETC